MPLLILAVMLLIAWYATTQTRYGIHLYAVGGDREAAQRAGIPVRRMVLYSFLVLGACAAVAGMVDASRQLGVSVTSGSGPLMLNAIAAAVVGGTSLFGGRGSIWSALLGALVIGSISNGVQLLGLSTEVQYFATGPSSSSPSPPTWSSPAERSCRGGAEPRSAVPRRTDREGRPTMTAIEPSWVPDPALVRESRIVRFATWLDAEGRATLGDVTDYHALHAWSAAHPGEFWAAVADFFAVDWSTGRAARSPNAGCPARSGSPAARSISGSTCSAPATATRTP